MVLDFYKLQEQPFGFTPDPRYLFMGAGHREALASILYGLETGCGFVALIGGPGLGKTTLLFHALNLLRNKLTIVFLSQSPHTPVDIVRAVLSGIGFDEDASLAEMQSRLQDVLTEKLRLGKRVVLVIDEAQNLNDLVLESVRMLSNFETQREKLIQIILCGQPQLAEKIASPGLLQLRQRISIFAHLDALSPLDTDRYIEHRLKMAGFDRDVPLFDKEARALIAYCSEGVPRNINNLCFNSLAVGCALKQKTIDAETVREAVGDLNLDRWQKKKSIVVKPANMPMRLALTFTPAMSRLNSVSVRWPRFAAVLAVSAVLVGGAFSSIHPFASSAADHANLDGTRRATAALAIQPEARSSNTAVQATNRTRPPGAGSIHEIKRMNIRNYGSAIRVLSGRTILGICIENFGKCGSAQLREIHRLNPRLTDMNHIKAGQSLSLPAVKDISMVDSSKVTETTRVDEGSLP